MARSRNIKPAIMANENLADLEPIDRLLFIYLWMLSDREGRLEDRPRRIRAEALPYDNIDADEALGRLADRGFINRYTVGDAAVIQIVNFNKHQNPHVRETGSVLPVQGIDEAQPRQCLCTTKDNKILSSEVIHEGVASNASASIESEKTGKQSRAQEVEKNDQKDTASSMQVADSKGVSGGDSEKHDLGSAEASPRSPDSLIPDSLIPDTREDQEPLSSKHDIAEKVIQHLNDKTGRNFKVATTNTRLINARLKEGATPMELIGVINRKCDEWLNDPAMAQYLRPATLFNAEKFNGYVGQLGSPMPARRANGASKHTGFEGRDYSAGLIEKEDGTYAF